MAKEIRNRQVIAPVAQRFREKLKHENKKGKSKRRQTKKHIKTR